MTAPTPGQTVGPFFGYALPFDGDNELVPPGRPDAIRLHGRVLDGETASRQGLVDEVCEPGKALETALALAGEIAANAPLSHGLIKSALARGPMPLEDLLALEVDAQAVLFGSEDFREGTTAFLEKRKPAFRGR